jgi:hypothetical protein
LNNSYNKTQVTIRKYNNNMKDNDPMQTLPRLLSNWITCIGDMQIFLGCEQTCKDDCGGFFGCLWVDGECAGCIAAAVWACEGTKL